MAFHADATDVEDKEILTWEGFGAVNREPAQQIADSGRTLVLVVDLLRGLAGEVRSAVLYAKPATRIQPDYAWKATDRWIVFPWSNEPPVTARTCSGPALRLCP